MFIAISPSPPSDPDAPSKNPISGVDPKIVDLNIVNTTPTSLTIDAVANITNPTKYFASIPFVDIHILKNGSLLGHATARNLSITPGRNAGLQVEAFYAPQHFGGTEARLIGRELISQYISGWNTTITLQMHEDSFPGNKILGRALSRFPIEVTAPKLSGRKSKHGGDGDDDPNPPDDPWNHHDKIDDSSEDDVPHFIKDATMHLLTSSATFLLLSPLHHSTLVITHLNATAFYRPSPTEPADPVGDIIYDERLAVPPLEDTDGGQGWETPRLPVDWSLGGVGYGAVKKALGGTLKLEARADVGVGIGRWRESVWYQGKGLGVRIRI